MTPGTPIWRETRALSSEENASTCLVIGTVLGRHRLSLVSSGAFRWGCKRCDRRGSNSAAASAAPANAGASAVHGSVINPSLVDLFVKKGILTTTEANSLRNMSGSAGMEQLFILLKAKGVVNDSEAAELKSAAEETHALDH